MDMGQKVMEWACHRNGEASWKGVWHVACLYVRIKMHEHFIVGVAAPSDLQFLSKLEPSKGEESPKCCCQGSC